MSGDVSSISQKLLTTSLVVTCDSVNSLLGNHMKSFDKIILSKLIFSVKVLMKCSREKCCMLFMSADYIKLYSVLWTTFMMEVNIMNPEQTATHATYKKYVQGSILWNQGHIVALHFTMFTS